MSRVHNFYAGPAIIPQEVLKKAQQELLDFNGIGLSIMEISHRSKDYEAVINAAEEKIRSLFGVPDNYSVLFLQGGATLQFGMIPMNLLNGGSADYINTGAWAKKAVSEAKKVGKINIIASSEDQNYSYIPKKYAITPNASYLHVTSNETIGGIQYKSFPETGSIPLVADMSSDILSRRINVSQFGLIYAGAQKNIGPSGVTLVIIRNDLVQLSPANLINMLSYKVQAEDKSLHNTPPTFGIYMVKLVMEWLENQGGISAMEEKNNRKAKLLYDAIDNSRMYRGTASKEDRSAMNITFRLTTEELENQFLNESKKAGMVGLKGHRSVGGCRASLYNGLPLDSVQALVDFMHAFEKKNS